MEVNTGCSEFRMYMQEMYFIQYFDYCVYMSNLHRTGTIAVDLDFLWYINSIFQIYAQQKEIPLL